MSEEASASEASPLLDGLPGLFCFPASAMRLSLLRSIKAYTSVKMKKNRVAFTRRLMIWALLSRLKLEPGKAIPRT